MKHEFFIFLYYPYMEVAKFLHDYLTSFVSNALLFLLQEYHVILGTFEVPIDSNLSFD